MTVRQDFYKPGDYNAICDGCGAKLKASEVTRDWKGFYKCVRCWEPRHPQDFVRARNSAEPAPVPFVRSPPPPSFRLSCSLNGRSAVAGSAVADCSVCDYIPPSYDPIAD